VFEHWADGCQPLLHFLRGHTAWHHALTCLKALDLYHESILTCLLPSITFEQCEPPASERLKMCKYIAYNLLKLIPRRSWLHCKGQRP
jgi:hypothetical protein